MEPALQQRLNQGPAWDLDRDGDPLRPAVADSLEERVHEPMNGLGGMLHGLRLEDGAVWGEDTDLVDLRRPVDAHEQLIGFGHSGLLAQGRRPAECSVAPVQALEAQTPHGTCAQPPPRGAGPPQVARGTGGT